MVVCTNCPIPAVTAIASDPPSRIRTVGRKGPVPAIFAPAIPAIIKPNKVIATIVVVRPFGVGANIPSIGINPPTVNAAADANAA